MKVLVQIVRASDGISVETEHTYPDDDIDFIRYHWKDGNYSCDCNRDQLLRRALGEPDCKVACTKGQFFVLVKTTDGEVIYDERTYQ